MISAASDLPGTCVAGNSARKNDAISKVNSNDVAGRRVEERGVKKELKFTHEYPECVIFPSSTQLRSLVFRLAPRRDNRSSNG